MSVSKPDLKHCKKVADSFDQLSPKTLSHVMVVHTTGRRYHVAEPFELTLALKFLFSEYFNPVD